MNRFDPIYVSTYYDAYGQREADRWRSGPRMVMQHALFRRHLHDRVRPGMRVLDAGCGPGTFAKVLLDIGADVTCLDISPIQLQACRDEAPGCIAYELGSITDLSRFSRGAFDVTLALGGALSYCFEQIPAALAELVRVTRPGGRLGLSVMNLFGSMHTYLPGVLELPAAANREILRTGDVTRGENNGHECHMFRVNELRELMTHAGLDDIQLHANGWIIPNDDAVVPDTGSEAWEFLLDAEREASRESPGAGTHIIAWGHAPA